MDFPTSPMKSNPQVLPWHIESIVGPAMELATTGNTYGIQSLPELPDFKCGFSKGTNSYGF